MGRAGFVRQKPRALREQGDERLERVAFDPHLVFNRISDSRWLPRDAFERRQLAKDAFEGPDVPQVRVGNPLDGFQTSRPSTLKNLLKAPKSTNGVIHELAG